MSPEQAAGRPAGPASDQFSLGAILYEMLAGRRAFDRGSKVATLEAIISHEPTPVHNLNPAVPPAVRRVIARCLAKEPERRYARIDDLDTELRRIQEAETGGLTRRRLLYMGGAAATAVVAVGGAWMFSPPHSLAHGMSKWAMATRDCRGCTWASNDCWLAVTRRCSP